MAKLANLFHFYNRLHRRSVYGEALVSLRRVVPNNTKKLKKGDKIRCIIAGLRLPAHRRYLQSVSFKDVNRAISLKDKKERVL